MPKRIPSFALLLALLLGPGSTFAGPAEPETRAVAFYRWYLKSLESNQEPGRDRKTLSAYVSASRLKALRKDMRMDDAGSDYFLKAQDYLEDWPGNIASTPAKQDGDVATLSITLGSTPESQHRLSVQMRHETDGWKIQRVQRLCADNAETQDDPCVAQPD